MIADYMFFGEMTYKDSFNTRVPRVTYRCKSNPPGNHTCKIVTDHAGDHLCICGEEWT